ncbi:lipocalin [Aliiroseovarius crassostreae]|uniref:Lipocalin n=1 Tax=Aliiroseovarius crassostreae TaxID=154981 RepID=A0A0P7IKH6_9RHOB|nr:YeeE/YedE family protein [Aliiroseovarius crassostreae]KPN64594.1 lipocalin [Aliiroseovarius crassostreae]
MNIVPLMDRIGERPTAALFGLITGTVFGVAAQRSRFCLRAATVEFARRTMSSSVAIRLLTFSTAVIWVQGAAMLGLLRTEDARMMAVTGSWSGAIIGGLMFGVGMVLASTGNLRTVMSGMLMAIVAQMSLHGYLADTRTWLASLWMTKGGTNVNLLTLVGLPEWFGLLLGLCTAVLALARRSNLGARRLIFGSGVGFAVALGWVLTFQLSQAAFAPVTVTSATFTGPSANTLMFFLTSDPVLEFDVGLVPGVVIGAFAASYLSGEFKFQGYEGEAVMRRSMTGAVMMGFGGMLAGGCAIGAGVTGGSIFVATTWLALLCIWVGAIITDYLVDQPKGGSVAQPAE